MPYCQAHNIGVIPCAGGAAGWGRFFARAGFTEAAQAFAAEHDVHLLDLMELDRTLLASAWPSIGEGLSGVVETAVADLARQIAVIIGQMVQQSGWPPLLFSIGRASVTVWLRMIRGTMVGEDVLLMGG